jgi:FkbM family methyltransferase
MSFVQRLARRAIYRFLPRGTDLFQDLSRHLPMVTMDVVFDVGANTGQSARDFLDWFPGCRLYCFEPVGDTFRRLRSRYQRQGRVQSFQLALGATPGLGKMVHEGTAEQFHLVDDDDPVDDTSVLEDVRIATLDEFCRRHGVDHISYLKIDTEGSDLDVLLGGTDMLAAGRVDLVQVEAGMNPTNETHVPFEELKRFLESHRYFLFGVYEQVPEWPTGQPHLRRSNSVFVAESAMNMSGR